MSWNDILLFHLNQNTLYYVFVVKSVLRILEFFTFLVFIYLFLFSKYLLIISFMLGTLLST